MQLITYLGNKRKLLHFIEEAVLEIKEKLGKGSLSAFDGFSGSGCLSRMLLPHCHTLYTNDLESYCFPLNNCYLTKVQDVDLETLNLYITQVNKAEQRVVDGIMATHYAPRNDKDIKEDERVFYTHENGIRIDSMRREIESIPEPYKTYCMASLLVQASIHTNTSGVFKGFHKKDGKGHFGGKGENALARILEPIHLATPDFIQHSCDVSVYQQDIAECVKHIPSHDICYLDPPYNQHPYGSNYFMLNLINKNVLLQEPSGVSGIVQDWNKSAFNYKHSAKNALEKIIKQVDASYVIISYNNEGIVTEKEMEDICEKNSISWLKKEMKYNTYRGCRNLSKRETHVKEILWILQKQ